MAEPPSRISQRNDGRGQKVGSQFTKTRNMVSIICRRDDSRILRSRQLPGPGEVLAETVRHAGGGHNKKQGNAVLPRSNGDLPKEITRMQSSRAQVHSLPDLLHHLGGL